MNNETSSENVVLRPSEILRASSHELSVLPHTKQVRRSEKETLHMRRHEQETWLALARCSSSDARAALPFEQAREYRLLPLTILHDQQEPVLTAVCDRELSVEERRELRFLCGMEVLIERHASEAVRRAIFAAYQGDLRHLEQASARSKEVAVEQCKTQDTIDDLLLRATREAPVPQLLEKIISHAIAIQASDVHLEPDDGRYRMRARVNGSLRIIHAASILQTTGAELVRHIKICSKLDTTLSNQPQEGGFLFSGDGWSIRLRVSIVPQRGGEKVVLRLLDNEFPRIAVNEGSPFQILGCTAEQEKLLKLFLGANDGTILIAGPTGSGKSTLLYTAIQHLNCEWRNIVTLEDPIERYLPGVTQCEVSHHEGMNFESFLKPVLRQDPDVVMIGEIRTKETADTALTAGITGHLVLSTVHAGSCIEVFTRLMQLGVSRELLGLSLRLIVAQRLVPKNCPACVREVVVPQSLISFFDLEADASLKQSAGCPLCAQSGISGRIAVYEMLPLQEALRTELFTNAPYDARRMMQVAQQCGYRPYASMVRDLLADGVISPERALRTIGIAPEIMS